MKYLLKKNPKPIPILEVIKDTHYSDILAKGANVLNEIPAYNIIEQGQITKSVTDIQSYYSKELVFFLIGCSFSFENALIENGIPLKHIQAGKNVAMYKTQILLSSVNEFKGNMVVYYATYQKR